jgi:hypothetical protein
VKQKATPRQPDTPATAPQGSAGVDGAQGDLPGKDLVLAALARALLITLVDPDASGSPLFLDQLLQALRIHLQDRYGDPVRPRRQRPSR